jgi:peptide/nickel transport system permease protein
MGRFLITRIISMAVVMIGISIIVFTLSRMSGDPRLLYMTPGTRFSQEIWDARGRDLGLDKPVVMQYLIWSANAIKGDFGDSVWHKRNSLGVTSAITRGSVTDLFTRGFALIGQAAPPFFLALVLIYVFAVGLDILPTLRRGDWTHFVLPVTTLSWPASASIARITRSSLLEVLDSEYVLLARAKGVGRSKVIIKHALKNALIAPLTVSAILFASFMTGTVVVETVFAWPGLGRLAVQATLQNDFPLVTGLAVIFAAIFVLSNLVADLLYAYIDPRIRII